MNERDKKESLDEDIRKWVSWTATPPAWGLRSHAEIALSKMGCPTPLDGLEVE